MKGDLEIPEDDLGGMDMVRKAEIKDMESVAKLAVLMWDKHTVYELVNEFSEMIVRDKACIFLKYENDVPVGFAQCQLRRDYVEGTETSPVGYLEGIFVRKDCRKKGYAKELLAECEAWAKKNRCGEFASDCEIDNRDSFQFHKAMEFTEVNRIICFTKKL